MHSHLIILESLQLVFATGETVVVFHSSVFQLSYFVELLESNKLLREVLLVELIEIFEAEHPVLLEFFLEDIAELVRRIVSGVEKLRRVLGRLLIVDRLILDYVHTCLEEAVVLGPTDYLFVDLHIWPGVLDNVCRVVRGLNLLRRNYLQITIRLCYSRHLLFCTWRLGELVNMRLDPNRVLIN